MNSSSTGGNPTAEKIAPYVLLGMTAVTGLVDAVSFLPLGSVFTANMTGNILILAFATARVAGLSAARSSTALIAFVMGAILGGRITARVTCLRKALLHLDHQLSNARGCLHRVRTGQLVDRDDDGGLAIQAADNAVVLRQARRGRRLSREPSRHLAPRAR